MVRATEVSAIQKTVTAINNVATVVFLNVKYSENLSISKDLSWKVVYGENVQKQRQLWWK
jgi:hypothetical protein